MTSRPASAISAREGIVYDRHSRCRCFKGSCITASIYIQLIAIIVAEKG